ncbi:MAG TPA: hypothetical protein VHF45_07305 [Thermoleophilaceae bacterium]|nr:hypothetical protein [Thermoleophilaceae bacterium]
MESRATTSQEETMEPAGATRLFAVWLWKEEFDAGSDYRGSVRDLVTGASRGFRDWSAMVAFMVTQVEPEGRASRAPEEVRDVG